MRVPVLARRVRLRVDESVGDTAVVEGVGEAAAQDLVEDGAGAAMGMRPHNLHLGFDPGR